MYLPLKMESVLASEWDGRTDSLFSGPRTSLGSLSYRLPGNKASVSTEPRVIHVDRILHNSKQNNKIVTSKYTLLNFIPLNLSEQFRRVVNFYFLLVTITAIVIDSPVSPLTSIIPLVFMVLVTAIKQGYEDWQRHKFDHRTNNKSVKAIIDGKVMTIKSMHVQPGMLVLIDKDVTVPADCVLLSTSGKDRCFVTTANLDGETNLKTLRLPSTLVGFKTVPNGLTLEVPPPQADLYTFYGRLFMAGHESFMLGPDNLLLRGSRVKNTTWVIGCAVYTGAETKLALNSKFTSNKFSSTERIINSYLLFFMAVLEVALVGCTIAKIQIEKAYPEREIYLGPISHAPSYIVNDFFSFLLLFHYIVPMSLYVTVETYKFLGAKFIGWDEDFSYKQPALVNTSDLTEELGQVEVLFSDKTGTLTQNLMVFKACSIKGEIYVERDNNFYCPDRDNEPADLKKEDSKFFFNILALCHSVQTTPEILRSATAGLRMSDDNIDVTNVKPSKSLREDLFGEDKVEEMVDYQASSPDEKALVIAASKAGCTFLGEEKNIMIVKVGGYAKLYERLQVIEFTSERKRKSIIVRDAKNNIWLYCKGAETSVFPLCENSDMVDVINNNIDDFAKLGLRTLAIAYRKIDNNEYEKIEESIKNVHQGTVEDMSKLYKVLEQKLTLVGATAVEDCLQDKVEDTLVALRQAGIRTWVLTGDKVETAVNVSQSCEHISMNDRKLYMIALHEEGILEDAILKIEAVVFNSTVERFVLILDGITVGAILDSTFTERFVELAMHCHAVLCCRLSPLQKAEVVKLVKHSPQKPITAAIGDGANDISMIQEAHVGFGIFGNEGHQAARCADYAFSDFYMLKKMLLVHGHWYYERMTTLVNYFFYKNIVLVLAMFYFQFHCAFSTQSLYDSMYITFYNILFTSVPCSILSLTDQRWPRNTLMRNPSLYKTIIRHQLMTWQNLFIWTTSAIYHTTVIYVLTLTAFQDDVINVDGKPSDSWSFGAAIFHLTIILVNLKLWQHARYHTMCFFLSIVLSIAVHIAFSILLTYYNAWSVDGAIIGPFLRLIISLRFWVLHVLVVITACALDFLLRFYSDNKLQIIRHLHTIKESKTHLKKQSPIILSTKHAK